MEGKKDVKKIIIIIESIIIFFLLGYIFTNNNKKNLHITTSSTDKEQSILDTGSQTNNSGISISKNSENNNEDIIFLNMNETVTKENQYELTVTGINFGKTILPPNTSGYYSYYEAKADGHQYLEVKYNYKNLSSSNITADDTASMTIKYDNTYLYTGFSVIEDDDSDFTYANITNIAPLTTGKLHYLFDVPDEVVNSSNSIVATIKVGTNTYEITLR